MEKICHESSCLPDDGCAFHPGTCRLGPKLFAGDARAFDHGFQFCPHNARVHASIELLLRESAVGAGDYVLAPDKLRKPHNAFRNEFWMFDDIRAVAHDARSQNLSFGKFYVLPNAPLM